MKFYIMLLAAVLMALAWLLPLHYRPWVTYTGELFAFFSLFTLAILYVKKKLHLPKISLALLAIAAIPIVQWLCGLVFFADKAFLASAYVFAFWLSLVLGYNLSQNDQQRSETFTQWSSLLLLVGCTTSIIAICQWLDVERYIPGMTQLIGNRPYGNFAQPNNMGTFLFLSLLASFYLYEKQKLKTALLAMCAVLLLIGMAMSQSRTIWIGGLCVLLYAGYQQYRGVLRLKWYWLMLWLGLFITFAMTIPMLSQLLAQMSGVEVTKTINLAARKDMSRLAIWQQMLHAIAHQPLWGYGWNQTSVAYTVISDYFQGPVWIRSAHNMVLDLLVWNGIVLGTPILAYLSYLGYQLHQAVRSTEAAIGILMVGVFLIHAMLEFPQNYAYFLLPIGFVIGIILSSHLKLKSYLITPLYLQLTWIIAAVLTLLVVRDYQIAVVQLNQSMRYEKSPEKMTNHQQLYVLEEFERRIAWIRMSPWQKLNDQQLQEIGEIVQNYPTKYDFLKYAKLLAYNDKQQQALHQLWLLQELRGLTVSYEQLTEQMPK